MMAVKRVETCYLPRKPVHLLCKTVFNKYSGKYILLIAIFEIEELRFSETSVNICPSTRPDISEEFTLDLCCTLKVLWTKFYTAEAC